MPQTIGQCQVVTAALPALASARRISAGAGASALTRRRNDAAFTAERQNR